MKANYGFQLAGKIVIMIVMWSVVVVLVGRMVGLM